MQNEQNLERLLEDGIHLESAFRSFEHRVVSDLISEGFVLGAGGEVPVQQKVRSLEVIRLLGQLLDWIAAVVEDADVAVDESDAGGARGGVREGRVVGHETEVFRRGLDLPD